MPNRNSMVRTETNVVLGLGAHCKECMWSQENIGFVERIQAKLEQGPVDHEVEFKCKVYENGRVAAEAVRVHCGMPSCGGFYPVPCEAARSIGTTTPSPGLNREVVS